MGEFNNCYTYQWKIAAKSSSLILNRLIVEENTKLKDDKAKLEKELSAALDGSMQAVEKAKEEMEHHAVLVKDRLFWKNRAEAAEKGDESQKRMRAEQELREKTQGMLCTHECVPLCSSLLTSIQIGIQSGVHWRVTTLKSAARSRTYKKVCYYHLVPR